MHACVYTCACAAVEWKGQRLKGKREGREKPVRNWKPSRGETSSDSMSLGPLTSCNPHGCGYEGTYGYEGTSGTPHR